MSQIEKYSHLPPCVSASQEDLLLGSPTTQVTRVNGTKVVKELNTPFRSIQEAFAYINQQRAEHAAARQVLPREVFVPQESFAMYGETPDNVRVFCIQEYANGTMLRDIQLPSLSPNVFQRLAQLARADLQSFLRFGVHLDLIGRTSNERLTFLRSMRKVITPFDYSANILIHEDRVSLVDATLLPLGKYPHIETILEKVLVLSFALQYIRFLALATLLEVQESINDLQRR